MSVHEKQQRHRILSSIDMQIRATDIRYRFTINALVLILRATQVNTDLFYLACSLISVVYLPRGYLSRSDSSSVHFPTCPLRLLSLNTLLRSRVGWSYLEYLVHARSKWHSSRRVHDSAAVEISLHLPLPYHWTLGWTEACPTGAGRDPDIPDIREACKIKIATITKTLLLIYWHADTATYLVRCYR